METKKTTNLLKTCWLVYGLNWGKGDVQRVVVARTKTAARQYCENKITAAMVDWGRMGEKTVRWHYEKFDGKKKYPTIQKYIAAINAGTHHSSCSLGCREYAVIQNGIWITGPNGERIHITKPNQKTLTKLVKHNHTWEVFVARIFDDLGKNTNGSN